MKETSLRNTNPETREDFRAYLDSIPFTAGDRPPLGGIINRPETDTEGQDQ